MSDFKSIFDILEKINRRLDSIDINLANQGKDLEYHIKRTDMLQDEMKPIREHVTLVTTGSKLLIAAGAFLGFLAGVYAAFK